MDYGEVLSRAWKIIWKYKVLWIFGILAGCSGNGGGGSGLSGSSGLQNRFQYQFNGGQLPPQWEQFFLQLGRTIENFSVGAWILVALVLILLGIIAVILGTVGRIGLIRGASQGDEYTPRLSFGTLFQDGLRFFWRVFLLNLLVGLASLVLLAVIFIPFVILAVVTLGAGLLCLVPLICLMVPAFWAVGVVIDQSIIAIVVEDLGVMAGLERGWDVFRRHLGTMIVMALILYVGGAIVGFILAIPALVALIPLALSFATINGTNMQALPIIALVLFLIYLPILIVLNGILQSYIGTAWTLTFRRLTGRGPGVVSPAAPPSPVSFPPAPPVEPINP